MSIPLIKTLLAVLFFSLLSTNTFAVSSTNKIDKAPFSKLRIKLERHLQKKIAKDTDKRKARKAKRKAERKDPILKWNRFASDFVIAALIVGTVGFLISLGILASGSDIALFFFLFSEAIAFLLLLVSIFCLILYVIKRKNK